MNPTTVRVDISVRGAWRIELADRGVVSCETLEEASRVAYRCAAERRPCELIVRDAYHRVVQRELITGSESRGRLAPASGRPSSSRRAQGRNPNP